MMSEMVFMIRNYLTLFSILALTSTAAYTDETITADNIQTEQKSNSQISGVQSDMKCECQQSELDAIKKDIAELKQSIQGIIQRVNNESHDYTSLEQKIIDFDTQISIKGESIINEVNNKLAEFAEKQAALLKEINASVNLQPTINTKGKLIVTPAVTNEGSK